MDQDWEIASISRDVVAANGGMVTVEWTLNQVPDREWFQFLVFSGEAKSGSLTFLMSDPTLSGRKLRFTVPNDDLAAAVRWIEKSIGMANQKFDAQVLSKRRREDEARQAAAAAAEQQLREARERLEKLDEG
jgi:hypothetical protein